ncbi:MAG: erythromycin esterase family protein [Bacteroidetes bacterium]|nr:erythromycin esterase family protein [Bacteroidota bacterium]
MKTIFLFLFSGFLVTCGKELPPPDPAKLAALSPHIFTVRSIDPDDTIFTDLQPLKSVLNNKKIVLLGEQSHGDGSVFLAKARLIKFLHEEMGFNVLAFESGLFECSLAEELITSGVPVGEAARKSVFDIWTGSKQFQPVIQYLEATRKTNHPLHLAGFDLQITGLYGRDSLKSRLQKEFKSIPGHETEKQVFLSVLDTVIKKLKPKEKISAPVRQAFYSSADSLIAASGKLPLSPSHALHLQLLKSLKTYLTFLWTIDFNKPDPVTFNQRDRQMGENLVWLMRNQYPQEKIIVWAASSHISRNRHEIRNRKEADTAMVPMGQQVWDTFRDSSYVLGFTAGGGRVGIREKKPWDLAKASSGTLEYWLEQTGNQNLWLDFKQLPGDHWLRDTLRARPFGYSSMLARWPEMMDGLFYIQTMTPSTGLE